jgi:hypothetical protein
VHGRRAHRRCRRRRQRLPAPRGGRLPRRHGRSQSARQEPRRPASWNEWGFLDYAAVDPRIVPATSRSRPGAARAGRHHLLCIRDRAPGDAGPSGVAPRARAAAPGGHCC